MTETDTLVEIASYATRAEAEMAKEYLEKNQIAVMLKGDDLAGLYGNISFTPGGFTLYVAKSDAEDASALISPSNL